VDEIGLAQHGRRLRQIMAIGGELRHRRPAKALDDFVNRGHWLTLQVGNGLKEPVDDAGVAVVHDGLSEVVSCGDQCQIDGCQNPLGQKGLGIGQDALQVATVGRPLPNTCCGSIPLVRFPLSSPQYSGVALPPRAYLVYDRAAKSLPVLTRESRVVCLFCPEALAWHDGHRVRGRRKASIRDVVIPGRVKGI